MDVKHERKEKEITETVIFTCVCFNVILFIEIFCSILQKTSNLFSFKIFVFCLHMKDVFLREKDFALMYFFQEKKSFLQV